MPNGRYVKWTTPAFGPSRLQALIPFSIAEVPDYISLRPMTSPFAAFRTKYGWPVEEVLRSYRVSLSEFILQDSMPLLPICFKA